MAFSALRWLTFQGSSCSILSMFSASHRTQEVGHSTLAPSSRSASSSTCCFGKKSEALVAFRSKVCSLALAPHPQSASWLSRPHCFPFILTATDLLCTALIPSSNVAAGKWDEDSTRRIPHGPQMDNHASVIKIISLNETANKK